MCPTLADDPVLQKDEAVIDVGDMGLFHVQRQLQLTFQKRPAFLEPDSAWVATAATNAAVVGEVSVRAVSLAVAGQNPGHSVLLKPTLITRDDLVNNKIGSIEELQQKFPAFLKSDAATAAWIPSTVK